MFNRNLWKSFTRELSYEDVEWIENRIEFLKETITDAKNQFNVENVSGDLDLDLHQYLRSPDFTAELNISPWLIHDAWLYYHDDGEGLLPEIREVIVSIFNETDLDLYIQIVNLLKCIELVDLIKSEVDAVVVLSFMDYLVTQLLYIIGKNRFKKILCI